MNLLALSGGERITDSLGIFPHLEPDSDRNYIFYFISAIELSYSSTIEEEDEVFLKYKKDIKELVLEDSNNNMIGKCPDYLIHSLFSKLNENRFNIFVHKINWNSPLQYRILYRVEFKLTEDEDLYSDKEYQIIKNN